VLLGHRRRLRRHQATISHHLKELHVAGLIERRKQGQFAYYRFRPEAMTAYLDELKRRMRVPTRINAKLRDPQRVPSPPR
jgi:DNA-binding transcriptional ArsR family regulator